METLTTTIPLHRDALLGLAATLTALAESAPPAQWATAKADQTVQRINSDALCATPRQGVTSSAEPQAQSLPKTETNFVPEGAPKLVTVDAFQGDVRVEVAETDKTGRVWDERIDSSNHKFTADGLWMRRRNVPDETYNAVVAELMGTPPAAEPAAIPPAAPPPPPPAEQPAAAPPPPVPAPPAASELTFGTLVEKIQQAGLNNALVTATCMEFELSGLSQVMSRPELIQPIHDKLFPPAQ